MNRRKFLATSSTLALGATSSIAASNPSLQIPYKSDVLTVAHLTDVHIRPEENIPDRAKDWVKLVKKHHPDFYLNGGDSIHDASYDGVTRERMLEQWEVWDQFRAELQDARVYSCIGNHDPWWDAPSNEDEMYGKDYVVNRLKMPASYYSFDENHWHFIILDGNHKDISLGEEQMKWLEDDLEGLGAGTPTLIMSHFPITSITNDLVGGQHSDHKELKTLFYKHKDKVRVCLSGHQHLLDRTWYNDVHYFCNGALSGFWWGDGDEQSAGKQYYLETPPGYAILKLHPDGRVENGYFPLT